MIKLNKKWKTLSNDSRYFICTGGRGSGKSFAIAFFLIQLIRNQSGHVVLFSRKTMASARVSIIPQFIEVLELLGVEKEFNITADTVVHKESKSKIWFKGLQSSSGENTANLKSIPITTWVLDEAEELTDEDFFNRVDLSIRSKIHQNRVILVLNPTTKEHFIYDRFFVNTGMGAGTCDNNKEHSTTLIHTTYLDNIDNLSESSINAYELMKERSPVLFEHVILGGWRDRAEGVIFENWKVGDFPDDNSTSIIAVDPGGSDPTAVVEVMVQRGNLYIKELWYETEKSEDDLSQVLHRRAKGKFIVIDSQAKQMRIGLEQKGHLIESVKKPRIVESINQMKNYDIIVDPTSANVIRELNNYCWLEEKSDTPIDAWNHLIDATRYGMVTLQGNPASLDWDY